jgi:competence protein ComEC
MFPFLILFGCFFYVFGILFFHFYVEILWYVWIIFFFSFGIFLLLFFKHQKYIYFILCCFISFSYGMYRMHTVDTNFLQQKKYILAHKNIPQTLKGTVITQPQRLPNGQKFLFHTQVLDENNTSLDLFLLIRSKTPLQLWYKNILEIEGKIYFPYNFDPQFPYADFLKKDKVIGIISTDNIKIIDHTSYIQNAMEYIFRFKNIMMQNLKNNLPYQEFTLAAGILIGERGLFSRDFYDAFVKSNLIHITAMSGFNITILILAGIHILLPYFHRTFVFFAILCMILFFVILAGWDSSVVRASIMGTLSTFAFFGGFQKHSLFFLAYSATCILLIAPQKLFFDIGFQLSVVATFGILVFTPYIQKQTYSSWLVQKYAFLQKRYVRNIGKLMSLNIAAEIAVLPFLIWHFHNISLIGLFTNILVEPLLPLVMGWSFLIIISSFFLPFMSIFIGYITFLFLHLIICIAFIGSSFEITYIPIERQFFLPWFFGLILIFFIYTFKKDLYIFLKKIYSYFSL